MEDYEWNSEHSHQSYTERENAHFKSRENEGMQDYQYHQEEKESSFNALNLQWVMGFNKSIIQGVHNLTTEDRTEIFYSSAHTGVIYNYETKKQKLL